MSYTQNMKDEKAPKKRILLPEGMRTSEVIGVIYETAKSGNPMFVFDIKDDDTGHVDKFYCVDVEGKRGNLKMILDACMVMADADGNYEWDNPDVIGKKIVCEIVHEPNEYINRKGETVKGVQHRIAEITTLAWEQ